MRLVARSGVVAVIVARVHKVKGEVALKGVTITAPADRATFATSDAMIAALTDGQQTASFGLPTEGEVQPNGTVALVQEVSRGVRMIAMIAAPWAKDAIGRSLPTWYVIDSSGLVLTQHVETDGAVYPLAADPRLTFGWGVYLNVTGAEAKATGIAAVALGGGLNIAICAARGLASTSNYTCYQKRVVGPSTGWYTVALRNCTG